MPASQHSLPTLDKLRSAVDPHLDARKIASAWFESFTNALASGDSARAVGHLVDDVFWRDTLALTWNFRTFQSAPAVSQFLDDQLPVFKPSTFILKKDHLELQQPYPDLVWIQGFFDFETTDGLASGVFRLVPLPDNVWKAHVIYTNLEGLKGHPEKIGLLRDFAPNHGKWAAKRAREIDFLDEEPGAVIVGGGQSGLEVAARLKHLGINALVVERNERIGDNWRKRYSALCLHDPVWYDHMPYLPFPPSWPVYTPALKLADWLESYAHTMELNVWTSATVESVRKGSKKRYTVSVRRVDGRERSFEVDHVVFALGIGAGLGNHPTYPGMDEFKGQILHSSKHDKASDHIGKKVAVVGACTSAHDICADYVEHGIDVTMVQRNPTYIMSTKEGMPRLLSIFWENGPPTDIADRINASFPNHLMKLVHKRVTKEIAEADKDLLDGLHARGFQTTLGEDDSGFLMLAWNRAGGYYLNVGASELIVEGKIKLKSGPKIERFTSSGIQFEDGSHLDTDVAIFATGYGDARSAYAKILGENLGKLVSPIWGLNEEGEINGLANEVGLPGIWCMMGNLALCRFYSKHVALQIKAYEEGVFGRRYA
ncbi:FAD/NAD(P)-binding domain-containing protein [Coniophora puteana RWD-64-598 SS2]|uniref:FAD/NAD(P)-binding domain-containing protein n=1 Tax=Coniophora puteana (strain RWD-64-598) TaxID=741705 RepID=A0A5M3MX44_CONPW|nr:FAD/NAD(P)-binding domain-containing protein [Coniophora puteana RWD-64-598 SS2]EIW83191.1 FAD/NAD(P)-binding domain-containing protein [Coniophora puteana RWD-64-598 SS2]